MYREDGMATVHTPFRYDYVGSFLRPENLKAARAGFEAGTVTQEALTTVENEAITRLVSQEKAVGYQVITDGEFRRSYWHLDFMWGFHGVEHIELEHGYQFHGEETTHGSIAITGHISGGNHPFLEQYKFVKAFEEPGVIAKQTIPAPAQMYAELFRGENGKTTRSFYPDDDALLADIAAAYVTFLRELYAAGCRNVQFDDCTWGMFCDPWYQDFLSKSGLSLEAMEEQYLALNNQVLDAKPEDLNVTTHVCRGNYHSTWASQGGYEAVAPVLFSREHVSAFYLEFDDERSGGFEPLRFVAPDKKVVLGLVTTKRPQLEDPAALRSRISEATRYVPLERLCLSPQCGFASCEIGNKLTEEEQWAKLRLVRDVALSVWG